MLKPAYSSSIRKMFGRRFVSSYIYLAVSFHIVLESESVIVKTSGGKIEGLITQTRKGRDIFTFYGIRYAEPPIGSNRFKPPVPVKSWRGIYNATIQGQTCMQNNPTPGLKLSEDCLFLDVFSTNLNASKPVIIFIHGGSFFSDSKSLISSEYILDKDIVLVSINYRLGAFGFFSVGTNDASGNQAFKDQLLAIKWVRDNIKAFGGDPNLVTLSGQSAGSFSVTLHLLSKQSYGLFHRAIAMSGSAVSYIESQTRRSSTFLILRTFCFRFFSSKTVECLQKVSADEILRVSKELIVTFPWYYDVESENVDEPFLTERPVEIARRGQIQNIPIMTGVTMDEFYFTAYELKKKHSILLQLFSVPLHNIVLPYALMYDRNSKKTQISSTLYSSYLHDLPITSYNIHNFGALISDAIIRHGVHRLVEYARHNNNVYYYRFDYQGKYSLDYYPDGRPLGVLHTDDLQYILVFKQIAPVAHRNDSRNLMIEKMISWWSKFAETGNPNDLSDNATKDVIWEPSNESAIQAIYLNEISEVSTEFYKPEFELLDSLFPLY